MKTFVLCAGFAATVLMTAPVVRAEPATAIPSAKPVSFAQVKAAADRWWDAMDANHDGRIDHADRDARLLERFGRWDTNHDGVISSQEFLALMHAHEGGTGPDERRWRHLDPAPGASPAHPGGRVAMAVFGRAMHEARHDGAITRAAFDAAVKAGFDRIDTNHDGTVAPEEMRAAWRQAGRGGRGPWRHRGWNNDAMPPPPSSGAQ